MEIESTLDHVSGIEKAQTMQNCRKHTTTYRGVLYTLLACPSCLLSAGPALLHSGGAQRSTSEQGEREGRGCPSPQFN